MNRHHELQCQHDHAKKKGLIVSIALVILLVGAATIWVLNIFAIITGPWGALLAAFFTIVSMGWTFFHGQNQPRERN